MAVVHLPKLQIVGKVVDVPEEIVYTKGEPFSYYYVTKLIKSDISLNAVFYQTTPERLEPMVNKEAVNRRKEQSNSEDRPEKRHPDTRQHQGPLTCLPGIARII